ncbi:MAG: OmpH family outer membrane protein [Ferruginibacter sp.]
MKKLVVLGIMAMSVLGFNTAASAQVKIGYINTEELIGSMPEAQKANAELEELQSALNDQGVKMAQELQEKDSIFVIDSVKLTKVQKDLRKKDLFELYQKVQGWSQYIQDELNKRQQTLVAPIRTKAFNTIKEVAKESGYSYVLDVQSVIVGPPGDDIIALVKKKMGIKDTPATTPGTGTKPPVKGQ